MADVIEIDQTRVTVRIQGEDTGGPNVKASKREQPITQRTCTAKLWPWDRALILTCLCAVAVQCLTSPVQTQCDSRGYMGDERKCDKKGFGQCGLVVRPCEEKVAIAFYDGAGGKRNQRGVGYVESGEYAEGV